MRIISGQARGRKLTTLPGDNTRPTLDRTREALFNILQTRVFDARVLDLFAGSGALALEALSRGAASAVLCDHSPEACAVIEKNIDAVRVRDKAQLLRDAGPWGQMFPEPLFDGHFRLLQQRLVGERHLKVMVEPVGGGPLLDGIAFNVDTALWPDNGVREVQLAYKLDINEFRGNRSLQIIIDNIWPI